MTVRYKDKKNDGDEPVSSVARKLPQQLPPLFAVALSFRTRTSE
jgi:hypothetical protein